MSLESAFTEFPTLRTGRLVLRELRSTDAQAIFDIFSNQEVMRFDSHDLYTSISAAEAFIRRMQEGYALRRNFRWGITLQGDETVIGTCSFHNFSAGFRCVETGYDLNRAYWGKGIMNEAMAAVLAHGFMDFDCHRIEAVADRENDRSTSLLFKLGFVYEGTLRQRYLVKDRLEDENYYAILKPEWLAKQVETR